jgi:hypothetical protein
VAGTDCEGTGVGSTLGEPVGLPVGSTGDGGTSMEVADGLAGAEAAGVVDAFGSPDGLCGGKPVHAAMARQAARAERARISVS